MTATNAYGSTLFNSDGTPKFVFTPPSGAQFQIASETVPTTSVDEAADCFFFVPVPEGRRIIKLEWDMADHDTHATPTLDMDLILRVTDKDGTNTDTVLFNAGTTFQSANQDWVALSQLVSGSADGYGLVGTKVVTGAAAAAQAASAIGVHWR